MSRKSFGFEEGFVCIFVGMPRWSGSTQEMGFSKSKTPQKLTQSQSIGTLRGVSDEPEGCRSINLHGSIIPTRLALKELMNNLL